MTKSQHIWDVVLRSVKTALEAYVAFVVAGGFNLLHVSTGVEVKVSLYAAGVAAIVNIIIKLHNAITGGDDAPLVVPAA